MNIGWRSFILGLALATGPLAAEVTEAERLVRAGLEAERAMDPQRALRSFQAAQRLRPDDAMIEQKIAQQLSDLAFLEDDPQQRIRLATEALPHAQRATTLDPGSAVARLSLAVLHGKLALEGDVAAKLRHARLIRSHAEEALARDRAYAWAWHVMGRWHAELSELGVARRAVITLFLGGLPPASLAESIRCLEEAVRLEPEAIAHHVELGFSYQQAGRLAEAKASWTRALALPATKIYDANARQRATAALALHRQGD